ncbi:hypothetical protein [Bacillus sp. FSL R12-0069]|uniref:hypothetical protein n=1 Tax=Bacillus sp. FSL R12-0069 TaxID=2975342 RepID=UPI0030F6CD8F
MLYAELTSLLQQSFRSDLFKVLRYYLEDTNYTCVTNDTLVVTDSLVEILIVYFQGSSLFLKWEIMGLEIDIISCKKVLHEIENAMRQRSSTLKHRNYFYSLLRDLGLQEDIPQDFLCMKKRLLELEIIQQKKNEHLVPMRQIHSLQMSWKKTFHQTLKVSKNITQGEVDKLFIRVYKKQYELAQMSKKLCPGGIKDIMHNDRIQTRDSTFDV